jgi:hypothetical protein
LHYKDDHVEGSLKVKEEEEEEEEGYKKILAKTQTESM